MDAALRVDPRGVGESREGDIRIWYGDAIGIWYEVDDTNRRVTVLDVSPAMRR